MVARVCLCLYMLSTLGMPWCLEQPASSVLERHPLFQFLCERFLVYKIHVYMGAYGAKSHKPSWIYGNKRYILDQLDLPLDRTAVERFELPFGLAGADSTMPRWSTGENFSWLLGSSRLGTKTVLGNIELREAKT